LSAGVLSDSERRLFARQVLLPELGLAGQQRLCASEVAIAADGDARAADVAREYLLRAGVRLAPAADGGGFCVPIGSTDDVRDLAGSAPLEACAAWLAGALAAVETIKHSAGIAGAQRVDPEYRLGAED
jgi:hypothetical protein